MQNAKMTTTCIRISPETLEKINKLAIEKKRSTSQMMRVILEKYIENIEL